MLRNRIAPLLAIATAVLVAALAASTAQALGNCDHHCDWIPYGEQWCGVDHWGDWAYGGGYSWFCQRDDFGPYHSYRWYAYEISG